MITRLRLIAESWACALLAAGCGSLAAPAPVPPAPTLVGTWSVSTVLDTFYFETPGDWPPSAECAGPWYCTRRRAAGAATLSGTLTVAAPIVILEYPSRGEPGVSGVFSGLFCDRIDLNGYTGCLHVAPVNSLSLPIGGIVPAPDFSDSRRFFATVTDTGGFAPRISFTDAVLAGDSIYGFVSWQMTVNRSPPRYSGRFVAHRVH